MNTKQWFYCMFHSFESIPCQAQCKLLIFKLKAWVIRPNDKEHGSQTINFNTYEIIGTKLQVGVNKYKAILYLGDVILFESEHPFSNATLHILKSNLSSFKIWTSTF